MSALTATLTFPKTGAKFEHVGQGVEAHYTLAAASGNGDTFTVPFRADHVAVENYEALSYTISVNSAGYSTITLSAGVTGGEVYRVVVRGRP